MAIDIDKTAATKLLNASYLACQRAPVTSCSIEDTIDFVMTGKNCLTYRYIMFTALLAKAVNPTIDILSLQAGDVSEGAYDARSLASKVVFRFQASLLGNILDGSNSDPLVNKPGRFMHLSPDNAAAGGDPKKALQLLCDDLPRVDTSENARECVDYIVSMLLAEKTARDANRQHFERATANMSIFAVHQFMSDLLDQGFGGAALVLVTTALYHLQYCTEDYRIVAHPSNQSGTSKRQFSDLDLFYDDRPFMGTELKDKPFSAFDVNHAAETAFSAGATSLLFVAGRQSSFASQPPTYFANTREKYAKQGLYVGVTSIDALMDTVLAGHMTDNIEHLLDVIRDTAEEIGALEAQMWIYEHLAEVTTE
ncbi:MAG: restriction endonuclease, SacI family [Oscillospiraceae bacterium]|nr:restriction endonuclease, SacI family [Oscillospiraceae bacterium]